MSDLPFVSICTPTYNRREYFNIAIKCVEWQEYPKDKIEWIIVNDGQEEIEDILNLAKKTRDLPIIKYYKYNEKMNIGLKRNICNQYATGDIIINMDDDDYYPPTRISHAVDKLLENPKIYFTFKEGVKVVSFISSPSVLNSFSVYFKSTETAILDAV